MVINMIIATITEVRNKLGKYLNMVQDGQEILITKKGKAVAKLIPVDKEKRKEQYYIELSDASKDKDFIKRTLSAQRDLE